MRDFSAAMFILLGIAASGHATSQQQLRMAAWFSDGMLLQTDVESGPRPALNGIASPGATVLVQVHPSAPYPAVVWTVADEQSGIWEVQLHPLPPDGTPREVSVWAKDDPSFVLTAKNVLFGDVFFCSGQSNMELSMAETLNATAEMATLRDDPRFRNFRFFVTGHGHQPQPQFDLPQHGDPNNPMMKCTLPGHCNQWVTAAAATSGSPSQWLLSHFSAACFHTVRDIARMHTGDRPMGLIQSTWGGTRVEAWMSVAALDSTGKRFAGAAPDGDGENQKHVLYNAMVVPWNRFAVRGAIWYQGEANAQQDDAIQKKGVDPTMYYATMLQAMVTDWRASKGVGDFAFVIAQLAQSLSNQNAGEVTAYCDIRWAQAQLLPSALYKHRITNATGLAVAMDLPGAGRKGVLHPPNKVELGRRLALQALHVAYAVDSLARSGPELMRVSYSTDSVHDIAVEVTLHLRAGSDHDLHLADVRSDPRSDDSCRLCCARAPPFEVTLDGGLTWQRVPREQIQLLSGGSWEDRRRAGQGAAVEGGRVVLKLTPSAPTLMASAVLAVQRAVGAGAGAGSQLGVRYAWSDYVDCALYNHAALPMPPLLWMVQPQTAGLTAAVA